jgi:hypothetical protein
MNPVRTRNMDMSQHLANEVLLKLWADKQYPDTAQVVTEDGAMTIESYLRAVGLLP